MHLVSPFESVLLSRRKVLDALRQLAASLPPAPSAHEALEILEDHRELTQNICLNELASPSTVLRHAVAAALKHLECEEIAPELDEIAEDPKTPDENRVIARDLARELRPNRKKSYAFPVPSPGRPHATFQLLDSFEIDPQAQGKFLAAWSSSSSSTRKASILGLVETRDPRILPLLEAAALDQESDIANSALKALSEFPDPTAREILEELSNGSQGAGVRRLAARYLLGIEPDPPGAQGKAVHCVAGPVSIHGDRDLVLLAPRTGGSRWDLLRVRISLQYGILSVETRPNLSASSAMNSATRLKNSGGFACSGPSYARLLLEDALTAREASPNRLGPWKSLLGTRPLIPKQYHPSERIPRSEATTNLRIAERLLRCPELRGWFSVDEDLDSLRELIRDLNNPGEEEVFELFLEEFLIPRKRSILRALELTRDLFARKGDRVSAKAVSAAEWTLIEGTEDAFRRDPFFRCLARTRLVEPRFVPATGF